MKNLPTKKGTIAYILNQHMNEIFSLINANNISGARKLALELIKDKSISDKQAVITASEIFNKSNDNLFLSSLMSYMTGMKVS